MTNPNDPWARRPDEDPTRYLGRPGDSATEKLHTSDYEAAYGESTTAYPANEPFGGWGQGLDPTRELPAYGTQPYGPQTQAYGPQSQAYAGQPQSYGGQPGGSGTSGMGPYAQYGPPGTGMPPGGGGVPPEPPRRKWTGVWIGLGIAALVLIGLVGVAAANMIGGGDTDSAANGTTSATQAPTRVPATESRPRSQPSLTVPSLPQEPPGADDPGSSGSTMGTIRANSGGTLTISTLSGEEVTVRTTPRTQVISLSAGTVEELPTGDLVIVQGQPSPDGSIEAELIISTSLEGGGR